MMTEASPSQPYSSEIHSRSTRPSASSHNGGPGAPPASYPAGWAPGIGLSACAHAFRRRWPMVVGLGAACGMLLGLAAWIGCGAEYRAAAVLHVAAGESPIVVCTGESGAGRFASDAYDTYQRTQLPWIKTPTVLAAALQAPEIQRLPGIRRQADRAAWLERQLKVRFPGRAEIMEVGLRAGNAQIVAPIVNAVVDAYLAQVADDAEEDRLARLDALEDARATVAARVESQQKGLRQVAERLGTGDPEMLAIRQRIALQDWAEHQRRLAQVDFSLRQAAGAVENIEKRMAELDERELTQAELDYMLRNDPMSRTTYEEYTARKLDKDYTDSVVRPGAELRSVKRVDSSVQAAEQQLGALQSRLGEEFRQRKHAELNEQLRAKQIEVEALKAQRAMLDTDLGAKKQAVERLGGSPVDLEMARAEFESLTRALADISAQIERVRAERDAAPRVTLIRPAATPANSVNLPGRLGLTGLAALVGFCLPAGLILWWDRRKRLVNSWEDVSRLAGAPVTATLPLVPRRLVERAAGSALDSQDWQSQLTESVDAIAARLLRQAALDNSRVVLITSAAAGEGKTSLATQLALSLARLGQNTALVDGSLRRPAIGEVFGVPPTPGVCEHLRGESGIAEITRSTPTQNLHLVTAGRCDRRALTALAGEAIGRLLDELHQRHDFVIVDGSPILPAADSRFLCQHTDMALLAVMRDVSRIPQVAQARDVLEAFAVGEVEAAVVCPGTAEPYAIAGSPQPAAAATAD